MQPFKINNLGRFCLTALCFLPIVFYGYSQTRLDRFYGYFGHASTPLASAAQASAVRLSMG